MTEVIQIFAALILPLLFILHGWRFYTAVVG